jgi:aminopeptidase
VPTRSWAELVHPDLDREAAFEQLWVDIAHICRLDADDPADAWLERSAELKENAQRLTDRKFDALQLHGPGTDLTIGLFPSAHWAAGDLETVDGLRHSPNLPTEETFGTPDPERVNGHVSATMPLELSGTIIEGIRVRFEGGRAVAIDADSGADALRAVAGWDAGASRLGEIALVDGAGRIGPLGRVFYDTLIDENAASHIALGGAYDHPVEDPAEKARINKSKVHVDFMIGSPELDVDGITRDGQAVPVLRSGAWQI